MRKVVAVESMSLDGVMESPEGWVSPYSNHEMEEAKATGLCFSTIPDGACHTHRRRWILRASGEGLLRSWTPSYEYTSTPVCMVIFHSWPTFGYTLHTLPFQRICSPSRLRHKVSMSTTANAPSLCS